MLFVNLLMLFCWCCKFAFLLVFFFFSRNISYQQHCQRCKSSHSIMYCLYHIVGIVLLSSPTASFTLPLISLYPPLPSSRCSYSIPLYIPSYTLNPHILHHHPHTASYFLLSSPAPRNPVNDPPFFILAVTPPFTFSNQISF